MRTIKFRGKSLQDKWIYGSLVRDKNCCAIFADFKEFDAPWDEVMVKPETVGQFTGLRDSFGKEIYEGDILKCVHRHFDGLIFKGSKSYLCYVVTKDAAFEIFTIRATSFNHKLQVINDSDWTRKTVGQYDFIFKISGADYVEILSNIHDDPELLKKYIINMTRKQKTISKLFKLLLIIQLKQRVGEHYSVSEICRRCGCMALKKDLIDDLRDIFVDYDYAKNFYYSKYLPYKRNMASYKSNHLATHTIPESFGITKQDILVNTFSGLYPNISLDYAKSVAQLTHEVLKAYDSNN